MTNEKSKMKIVVIGGTGLIGSKVVRNLGERGYEAVAAAPNTGVNTLTGEGLADVLKGASVVGDVSNSPSFEDAAVRSFFQTSTRNLLSFEVAAGVGHHVALSIVGTDRLPDSGYMRAKVAQEKLIKESSIPYSIVRATQFFEFLAAVADVSTVEGVVRLSPALMQPMSADDVASALADYTLAMPADGIVEIAGPDAMGIDAAVGEVLLARGDPRKVITDNNAKYYGLQVTERSLMPGKDARLAPTRLTEWLTVSAGKS